MRAKPELSLFVMLLALGSYSCPTLAQTEEPLFASIRKAGGAKVAMGSSPPWIYVSSSGEAKGYHVEVIDLVLMGLGLPAVTPALIGWEGQIPALQAHQVDFIAPGLLITEARCKMVTYSGPVFAQQDGLYVLPGNPKHLTGYSQVALSPDVKLAVITGSSQEAYALKRGVKPDQLVRVPDIQAGIATVTGGRANALALGQFSVPGPEQKGVEVVVDGEAPMNGYGVVFRKEDVRFRDEFNKQLDVLRSNGTMKELYAVKYGAPNWDVLSSLRRASDVAPSCE